MTNSFHLLVVDDDRRLRDLLVEFLTGEKFRVQAAASAAEARAHLACHVFDLIVMDVMMPGEDGLQLTKSIRQSNQIPILMLTARDQLEDRIDGLNLGADDYLTKPFEPRELLARIHAILRRFAPEPNNLDQINLGQYKFDTSVGKLTHEGNIVHLSSTELILLRTLAQMPRQPFARDDLAQRIGHRVSERTVDVQITRLRRRINDDPRQPKYLQTIRHIGYALCPD